MSTLLANDPFGRHHGARSRNVALAAIVLLTALTVTGWGGWAPGTPMPSLVAAKLEGTLPAFKGKVVLMDFWASWCSPCTASFPALDTLNRKYSAKGLVVLGINVDDKSPDMQRFLERHAVSFTIVRDVAHVLVAAADVQSLPSSYLFDRQGHIRYVHTGFHGDKTIEEYTQEIEALLNESQPGKP